MVLDFKHTKKCQNEQLITVQIVTKCIFKLISNPLFIQVISLNIFLIRCFQRLMVFLFKMKYNCKVIYNIKMQRPDPNIMTSLI